MAYSPDPYDFTQPVVSVAASTLTAELRAIKSALTTRRNVSESNTQSIATNGAAIESLGQALAAGTRFALLTNTIPSTFTVPAGVTELLVVAIGGGQGGQGGNGKIRCRFRINGSSNNYKTGSYGDWHQLRPNGAPGSNGKVVMQLLSVVPEEEYTYQCGAGGSPGAASIANISHTFTKSADSNQTFGMTVNSVNGLDAIVTPSTVTASSDGTELELPTGIACKIDATTNYSYTVLRPSNQGGNYTVNTAASSKTNVQLACGSLGTAGGNTRFGIPSNPNDPSLLDLDGGSDALAAQVLEQATIFTQRVGCSPLGNFGVGGMGGRSSTGDADNAAPGAAGTQGAILVMW